MNNRKQKFDKEFQSTFVEDLEESLLKNDHKMVGIDEFESIYNKKKLIGHALEYEKNAKEETKENLMKIKQRVYQIQQLNERVNKQASLMKNQFQKINQAHTLSKILMMEKIVKLQRQTQDIQRKRQQCYEVRAERQRSSIANQSYLLKKMQRNRIMSFCTSKALKNQIDEKKYEMFEENKQKADFVRAEQSRRKQKSRKIQKFKEERAKNNYTQKMISLKNTIDQRGNQLRELFDEEQKQERHVKATKNVTTQYLNSFFATETL